MLLVQLPLHAPRVSPQNKPGVMTQVEPSLEVLLMHEQKMSLVIPTSG